MKIKNAAAKILLPVMILSFLVSCASKKSGNTDIKQDTAQGTAQNSDLQMVQDLYSLLSVSRK